MFDDFIDKTAKILFDSLPNNLERIKSECQSTFKQILKKRLENLDIVSRDEFDAQKKVLARTRAKVEMLEKKLDDLLRESPKT